MRASSERELRACIAMSPAARERFWDRVDRSAGADGCWPWIAGLVGDGYGEVTVASAPHRAHRVAYVLHYGTLPDDLLVCHACDNRKCCNPLHLWLGTAGDNLRDMTQKGRHYKKSLTRCPQGHEYTVENTYVYANGTRRCRTCRRDGMKQRRDVGKLVLIENDRPGKVA